MAIQTRYAGDANGINNVDAKVDGTLGTVIATGLTKNPIPLKITGFGTFSAAESGTGGAVETILRSIAIDSTIVMYQVDTSQMSVLLEANGSSAATIQTRLQQLVNNTTGGNIGIAGNLWAGGGVAVSSSNGFKLA
jgi:hypothetical protein